MAREYEKHPSLENLVEQEELGLETLHPGGLAITRELANLCHIEKGTRVLDVASGTGESVCYLAATLDCHVVGVDHSPDLLDRARKKTSDRQLSVDFKQGDAHNLPFADNSFDVVTSECAMCLLDKERAIREMVRVTRSGGYIGIHDICWKESTPDDVKHKLDELEGERPETLKGWKELFKKAGLTNIRSVDESHLIPLWMREIKKKLGLLGQLKIVLKIIKHWGVSGYKRVKESEKIFQSEHLGYGIIVGKKA